MVKFDLLCRKAEGRMQSEGTFSGVSVAVSRLQNAALRRPAKPSALVSTNGSLGVGDVALQMRRLLGPVGGGMRQDVLSAGGK